MLPNLICYLNLTDTWRFFSCFLAEEHSYSIMIDYRVRLTNLIIIPPGQKHRIYDHPEDPVWLFGLCIEMGQCSQEPYFSTAFPQGKISLRPELSFSLRAELRRMLYEQSHESPGRILRIKGIGYQILAELMRQPHSASMAGMTSSSLLKLRVHEYIAQLESTFFEQTHIDAIAHQLGMSRRRLRCCFEKLQVTPGLNMLCS